MFDLLNPASASGMNPAKAAKSLDTNAMNGLRIRWSKKEQFVAENLYSFEVSSPREVLELFKFGSKNRVQCAHNLNELSSRSHSIFSITVESQIISE